MSNWPLLLACEHAAKWLEVAGRGKDEDDPFNLAARVCRRAIQDADFTIEVVVNRKYGGYSLSPTAVAALVERGQVAAVAVAAKAGKSAAEIAKLRSSDNLLYEIQCVVPRHDPTLIAIVRELGDAANGECAKLEIREVTLGYAVEDRHDGMEVVTTHT